MAQSVTGPEIERLIQLLSKLPGLGPRSARRAALHLIKKKDELLVPLAKAMDVAVEDVADLWALERAAVINARYHVLGGALSPLDGIGPDDLGISKLVARV